MTHHIYGLYDPRIEPRVIRYIGYTGKSLSRRLSSHVREANKKSKGPCHRRNWILSLLKDGVRPKIVSLERVNEVNWQEREQHWIALLKDNLTNSTSGGEGLINPSPDIRERISKKVSKLMEGNQYRKGIPHTEETRQRISQGLKSSDKFKKAVRKFKGVNRLAVLTPEERKAFGEKIRKAKLGVKRKPFTEETKRNMSQAHLGKKHTEETKAKMRGSGNGMYGVAPPNKGKRQSQDTCEAIRKAKLGSKWINNGSETRILPAGSLLPEGWKFGRLK